MYTLGVRGDAEERRALLGRIVERIDAPVATITRLSQPSSVGADLAEHQAAGAAVTHGLGDDRWIASGGGRSLGDLLDTLAPTYDYAVVEGVSEFAGPTVVVGADHEPAGSVLARGETAESIDVTAVLAALEETNEHVTLESLITAVTDTPAADRAGAVATFTGRVRRHDGPEDPPTDHLVFERYDELAAERLRAIERDLVARDGVHAVRTHHRTGVIDAGEDIVFVVVLAGHREEAFRAVEDGIDRLKDEVPIFKKEVTVDDAFWRH